MWWWGARVLYIPTRFLLPRILPLAALSGAAFFTPRPESRQDSLPISADSPRSIRSRFVPGLSGSTFPAAMPIITVFSAE
jgi:hypothetical protein